MFKTRSKLFFLVISLESILCIWGLFYFNYLDRLTYKESLFNTEADLALLIQNMFTSTWWALIILTLSLIAIFGVISFIYTDLKFQLGSILLWFILFILALDVKDSLVNIFSTSMIFIPLIFLNILAYYNQKKIIEKSKIKK